MPDTTALSRGDAVVLCRGIYPQKLLHLPLTGWPPASTLDLRVVPSPLYPLVRSIHSCNAQVWRNVPVQTTCCCLNCWAEGHGAQGCRWHRQPRIIARARRGRRRWQGRKVPLPGQNPRPASLPLPHRGGGEGGEGRGHHRRVAAAPRSWRRLPLGGPGRCGGGAERPSRGPRRGGRTLPVRAAPVSTPRQRSRAGRRVLIRLGGISVAV